MQGNKTPSEPVSSLRACHHPDLYHSCLKDKQELVECPMSVGTKKHRAIGTGSVFPCLSPYMRTKNHQSVTKSRSAAMELRIAAWRSVVRGRAKGQSETTSRVAGACESDAPPMCSYLSHKDVSFCRYLRRSSHLSVGRARGLQCSRRHLREPCRMTWKVQATTIGCLLMLVHAFPASRSASRGNKNATGDAWGICDTRTWGDTFEIWLLQAFSCKGVRDDDGHCVKI